MFPFRSILSEFQLGKLLKKPCLVKGGVIHKTWRLETDQGIFAIKALNLLALQLLKETVLPISVSEQIAYEMMKQGIPGISSRKVPTIGLWNEQWMVFDWVEGDLFPSKDISLNQVFLIGQVLYRIHQTVISVKDALPHPNWVGLPESEWRKYIETGRRLKLNWSEMLEDYLSRLIQWSRRALDAQSFLNQHLVVAHRDFDAKNVLWRGEQTFTLMDWEYAGLTYPQVDLLAVAMNWAGIVEGSIDEVRFKKILEGYGEPLKITDTILAGYLGYCIDWLIFNVRYGLSLREPSEKIHSEIRSTLRAMDLAVQFCS